MEAIYLGNDHLITVTALRDSDGVLVTGGTVQATLLESDGATEVTGLAWPITLSEVGAGTYKTIMDKAVVLLRGSRYLLRVVAAEGTVDARWDITVQARHRT
jgi:hypothetical protein